MNRHTPGPWVGFSDQGKTVAIMPAGRDGDICTFQQPPSEADASLMILAPALLDKLSKVVKWLERLATAAERGAQNCSYESLREAYIADANNYRKTISDIMPVLEAAQLPQESASE